MRGGKVRLTTRCMYHQDYMWALLLIRKIPTALPLLKAYSVDSNICPRLALITG